MRRALSSLLLVLFSYTLIVPIAASQSQTVVPDCCRKAGKHQCVMSHPAGHATGGVGITKSERCPFFPIASIAPGQAYLGSAPGSAEGCSVSTFSHASGTVQTEARHRISFTRSGQKRGPPAISPSSLAC